MMPECLQCGLRVQVHQDFCSERCEKFYNEMQEEYQRLEAAGEMYKDENGEWQCAICKCGCYCDCSCCTGDEY